MIRYSNLSFSTDHWKYFSVPYLDQTFPTRAPVFSLAYFLFVFLILSNSTAVALIRSARVFRSVFCLFGLRHNTYLISALSGSFMPGYSLILKKDIVIISLEIKSCI